jgi:hypothetical protein
MVKFVTFNKQEHPVRVSYYALSMLKEKFGKDLASIKEDEFEAYEILFFYSLESGYKITGKEFTFKQEVMKFALDQCFFEFIELIPTFFPDKLQQVPGKK